MPSQSLSDTDVDDVEEADDVEDDCAAKACLISQGFPVVALNQHLSSVF